MAKTRMLDPDGQRKKTKQFVAKTRLNKKESTAQSKTIVPNAVPISLKKLCLADWRKATSTYVMKRCVCAVCGEYSYATHLQPLETLPNKDLLKEGFSSALQEYRCLGMCLVPQGVQGNVINCCKECYADLVRNKLPALSVANGFQFGTLPNELCDLTIPEKMLISAFRTHMCVVKLKQIAGHGTSQHAIKGNSITFPQNVMKVAACLPANVDTLPEMLKVIFIGKNKPTKEQMKKFFQVRRQKVLGALNFLKKNHSQYCNILIDHQSALNLPIDDVPNCLWESISLHTEECADTSHPGYAGTTIDSVLLDSNGHENNDNNHVIENTGVVDVNSTSVSTQEIDEYTAQKLSDLSVLIPHGSNPINEYQDLDMWVGGYPHLFPYGRGGPDSGQTIQISLKRWIKHILHYFDNRFGQDSSFLFHIFNVLQKREVCLQTSLTMSISSQAEGIAGVTAEDLKAAVKGLAKQEVPSPRIQKLIKQIKTVGTKVRGSPYARQTFRREIQSLMINLGMPAFFITINPADLHSPIVCLLSGEDIDLNQVLHENIPTPRRRAQIVAQNPVAVAEYFHLVITAFVSCVMRYKKEEDGVYGHVTGFYGCVEEQGIFNCVLISLQTIIYV